MGRKRDLNQPIRGRQGGIALILVLWSLVLLTVIAGTLTMTVRTELSMTRNLVDEIRGRALAEAGLNYVLASYTAGGNTSLREALPADGQLREWYFEGYKLRVGLVGEDGRINLNLADEALIKGALAGVGLEADLAQTVGDAIVDWRDTDNLRSLHGAEDRDYEMAGYAYGAKDNRFESVDELGLVYAVNKQLFERISPLFTVDSGVKTINPSHASRPVLLSIPGISEDQVNAFLVARDERGPFDSAPATLEGGGSYAASTRSHVYRLLTDVQLDNGFRLRAEMTVDLRPRGRKRYRILRIRYNAPISGTGLSQVQ